MKDEQWVIDCKERGLTPRRKLTVLVRERNKLKEENKINDWEFDFLLCVDAQDRAFSYKQIKVIHKIYCRVYGKENPK